MPLLFLGTFTSSLIRLLLGPFLKRRRIFEEKNNGVFPVPGNPLLCVHVASVGEWEQARPLVTHLLERGESVEILYTSPSAEKILTAFAEGKGNCLSCLRLPLVSGNIQSVIRARNFAMVRYDFFPELLVEARKRYSFLLWASVKKKRPGPWAKMAYGCFDVIVPARQEDAKAFESLGHGHKLMGPADFREKSIGDRLNRAHETLEGDAYARAILNLLDSHTFRHKFILGNYHPEEKAILKNKLLQKEVAQGQTLILLVPHFVEKDLCLATMPLQHVGHGELAPGKIVLFDREGLLLELYTLFDGAFVGGGHTRGVHSLLEPYRAGASLCHGPRTHRSTEYDTVVKEAGKRRQTVEKLEDVYSVLKSLPGRSNTVVAQDNGLEKMLGEMYLKMMNT